MYLFGRVREFSQQWVSWGNSRSSSREIPSQKPVASLLWPHLSPEMVVLENFKLCGLMVMAMTTMIMI